LWGHLRFGLDILASSSISRVDPYSYLTTGQEWINHEWLAEVSFALSWLGGGSSGMILFKIAITGLAYGIIFRRLLKRVGNPIRAGILLILSMIMVWIFLSNIRPHIFTILFFTLTLIIITEAEDGSYRWLWFTPIIMGFWVNLHGGFLAGIGVLGLWAIVHLLTHFEDWPKIIPPVALALLATLLNPYGPELHVFLYETALGARLDIVDWNPVTIRSIQGGIYLLLVILSIVGLNFSKRKQRTILVILYAVIAIAPLFAIRHLQLFSVGVLILAGEQIITTRERLSPRLIRTHRKSWFAFLPFLASLIIFIMVPRNLKEIKMPSAIHPYPYQVKELLKESGIEGNLAVLFNWGEYVIWHLGPKIMVGIDGRRETIYADETYQQYLDFHYGLDDWDAVLAENDTDLALVKKDTPSDNLISLHQDWEMIFEGEFSVLYASIDSHNLEQLKLAAAHFKPPQEQEFFP
jgi:hypothetical protein